MMKKKLIVLIISLISIFGLFLFLYLRAHNYEIEYSVNNVAIKETYVKNDSLYKFLLTYKDKNYEVINLNKYSTKRRLITNIDIKENAESICLYLETNHVKLYPICSNDDEYFSPFISSEQEFRENNSFKNIKIDNLNDKKYFIWDYKEFNYLSSKKESTIKLFDKDVYNLNLIYQTDNYLLVPNYDEDYKFTKLNIINSNNGKIKEMNLRYEVYFDSYFLGHAKNKVYLYDSKSEQEYYFDLKKNEIYKSKYQILNNGKWEKVTNQKLKNNKLSFIEDKVFDYKLDNNTLYGGMPGSDILFKVTNKKVSTIVKIENLDVYYISKDTLYYFNPTSGEIPLLKYSEWEFNNINMIYIF